MLVEYIKKNGQLRGVVVAVPQDNSYAIGWSLCKKCDSFDKSFGLEIAKRRAQKHRATFNETLAHTVRPHVEKMRERASRYFKDRHEVTYKDESSNKVRKLTSIFSGVK